MKEAESIKPGERIAISCGNCGGISTFIADKDRTYLKRYTCDKCKAKFVTVSNPHGGSAGYFVYEDDAGHKAQLLRGR